MFLTPNAIGIYIHIYPSSHPRIESNKSFKEIFQHETVIETNPWQENRLQLNQKSY